MMGTTKLLGSMSLIACALGAYAQITAGQTDTFPANIQNWGPVPPQVPAGLGASWVSTGGPAGAGDAFLRLDSNGGIGAGSRMAGFNSTQWAGNYVAAGVTSIDLDFKNLGPNALEMRLTLFDSGLTTQWVSNNSIILAVGTGWQHFSYSLTASNFTLANTGLTSFNATLSNVGRLMFRHDPPPVSANGVPILGALGLDNIHAAGPVPEPASILVLSIGLLALRRRRR